MPSIAIEDLVVEYEGDGYRHRPIDGMTRSIADGDLALLLGPSGCGKTTLLSCLGGLLRPTSGRVLVGSADLSRLDDAGLREHRRQRVGFVFQAYNLIASLSARDNVAAPLVAQGANRRLARERADAVLAEVGMADHAGTRPGQLSGGQQQRIAVARGLVHGPEVLLADEPTANLDYVQAEAVIQLLRGLARPGRVVVISTHDDRLLPIADDVLDLAPRIDAAPGSGGPVALADGEVLFHEGDRGPLVYAITSGEVVLTRTRGGAEETVAVLGAGRYFGELGPMLGQPRTATARARGEAHLESMTLQQFRVRSRHDAHDASTAARAR